MSARRLEIYHACIIILMVPFGLYGRKFFRRASDGWQYATSGDQNLDEKNDPTINGHLLSKTFKPELLGSSRSLLLLIDGRVVAKDIDVKTSANVPPDVTKPPASNDKAKGHMMNAVNDFIRASLLDLAKRESNV